MQYGHSNINQSFILLKINQDGNNTHVSSEQDNKAISALIVALNICVKLSVTSVNVQIACNCDAVIDFQCCCCCCCCKADSVQSVAAQLAKCYPLKIIIKKQMNLVSITCKSHNFKTANMKISSASSIFS